MWVSHLLPCRAPAGLHEVASRRAHRRAAPGPRALTLEEACHLCERLAADAEAVELDLPDLVEFMLGTGVRIGEACAVRWSAVDPGRRPPDEGVADRHVGMPRIACPS